MRATHMRTMHGSAAKVTHLPPPCAGAGARCRGQHAQVGRASTGDLRRAQLAGRGCQTRGCMSWRPHMHAHLPRSGGSPEQKPLPEARRSGCRARGALRRRCRRSVRHLVRRRAVELLVCEAALAGRGRRGLGGRVAERERDHHGPPQPDKEVHSEQHATQATACFCPVAHSTAQRTALLLL